MTAIIRNADVKIWLGSKFVDTDFFWCRMHFDFPIKKPASISIGDLSDFYTAEFLDVFTNCRVENCIMTDPTSSDAGSGS